jgi:hypothetical protein
MTRTEGSARWVASGIAALLAAIAIGCSSSSPAATATVAPTESGGAAPTSEAPAATETSAASTATAGAPATGEIAISGDDAFVAHAEAALGLLAERDPEDRAYVGAAIATIELVDAGSGMYVETKTFKAGQETAYAPGWPEPDQQLWFASTIVHDACHSTLYSAGEAHTGKDAELACLAKQLGALQAIGADPSFISYVQGLIDGADDPNNQYWNVPLDQRHW